MEWFIDVRVWMIIVIFVSLSQKSEESCEMFAKTTTIFRMERVLYRYVACTNMTVDNDLRDEIISKLNDSHQYLEVTKSNIPIITKNMFQTLNLTQITVEAKVQVVQGKAFERANISNIIMDNNDIKKLESGAFNSYNIFVLSLRNNSLTEISTSTFSGLANLRKLTLQNNQISVIQPGSFNDLEGLNELNLGFNKLTVLQPNLFDKLQNMQTIYLNNNLLKQLPVDVFSKNGILQYLSIQNNLLIQLDATVFPQALLYVNAAENNLKSFNMSGLINLDRIVLDSNKLTTIVNCLNNLPSLSFLHLNHNYLEISVPTKYFEHLSKLSILEIDNNHLVRVDFSIFRYLMKLEGLSLAENNLTSLDVTDINTSIKHLNLSGNSLVGIKNLWRLSNLDKLELGYNSLQEITFDMFANISLLRHLWLQHNSIRELHLGCFRDLKSLTHLNLSYNSITNITPGILTGLNSLIELDISHNNLVIFDEDSFHNTRSLRFLNIAHNNLSNVDIRGILSHTIWLREINLNGNNWTCKMLIDIEQGSKIISFVGGNSFNVSNVYGVPCIHKPSENENGTGKELEFQLTNILEVLNSTMQYTRSIHFTMSVLNYIMAIFFCLVGLKYVYDKYSSTIAAAQQFVYRPAANEQEIQLL
ncbi:uncharacterized protein [Leptinotarsa decemlineata]|uniref:uncharacterized protein n=1 Tax=Leptinotarsa decemlineata TaxID=7539 RepID=UPI003D309ECF